jgi:hypothetical protein
VEGVSEVGGLSEDPVGEWVGAGPERDVGGPGAGFGFGVWEWDRTGHGRDITVGIWVYG